MAAQNPILDQVDETADSLMESMCEVQTTIYELHSTVSDLLNSMSEMLKSMSEMKATLDHQPTTESLVPVDHNLPESSEKQSIAVVGNSTEEEKIHVKKVVIEMPVFEGVNVYLWISRAERYFEIGNFTETEKLRLVYSSVDGEALNWYNLWKIREPFVDWNDLKYRLLDRFGENLKSGSALERLLGLKQVGSVILYLSQFEELASHVSEDYGGSDYVLELIFVNGLKEEIRKTVRLFQGCGQTKGLKDLIRLALRLEDCPFSTIDCSSSSPQVEVDDDITK